jgi:hypothetical protein
MDDSEQAQAIRTIMAGRADMQGWLPRPKAIGLTAAVKLQAEGLVELLHTVSGAVLIRITPAGLRCIINSGGIKL